MHLVKRLAVVFVLLASGLLLAACGSSSKSDTNTASAAMLPDWARSDPPRVREAYEYAVANPEELAKYPCYCGCGAMGHKSNYHCYAQGVDESGQTIFDGHALGCSICVDITLDSMRLLREGKDVDEIKAFVDRTYSKYGPPTEP